MDKLIHNNRGNITPTVLALALLVAIFTIPIVSLMFNTNVQARNEISRVQYFYKLKAELSRIESKLGEDIAFLHNNPSGSMGVLSYNTVSEDYTDETQSVYNEYTGQYEDIVIAHKYTYKCSIEGHIYNISSRLDLVNNTTSVMLLP